MMSTPDLYNFWREIWYIYTTPPLLRIWHRNSQMCIWGLYRVVAVKGDHLVRIASLATGKEVPRFVSIQKLKRAYGPWRPALTKPTNNPHPTNQEVSDQSRRFHTQPEPINAEYLTGGARAESWRDPPAPPNMASPHTHGGPTINHDTIPGGRKAGQSQNQLTDRTGETLVEEGLVSKKTRQRKKGGKGSDIQKPSQETGIPSPKPQVTVRQSEQQVSSGKKVPMTLATHGQTKGKSETNAYRVCII